MVKTKLSKHCHGLYDDRYNEGYYIARIHVVQGVNITENTINDQTSKLKLDIILSVNTEQKNESTMNNITTDNKKAKWEDIYCKYGQKCKYMKNECKKIHVVNELCPNDKHCRKMEELCAYKHTCKKGILCDNKERCYYYHPPIKEEIDYKNFTIQGLNELCKNRNINTDKCTLRQDYIKVLSKRKI